MQLIKLLCLTDVYCERNELFLAVNSKWCLDKDEKLAIYRLVG